MRGSRQTSTRRGNAFVSRCSLLCLSIALIVSSARLVSGQRWPVAQDATLRRITVSNDDGDVYVESSGDGSEIVLKTEKVRVDGDVYCGSSTVGLSAHIDALKTKDDALDERIDTLNDTQVELRDDLDALETSSSGRLSSIDTTLSSLSSVDTSLSAIDASLSSRIDVLNATDAQLKATDETLATRIASLNATGAVLKGVDDDLSSRIDALRDIYVNELNVTDKQLIVTDATLGSRIDDLNATQYELKSADAALSSRIATLESAHEEYERIDDEVASLIDALNATDAVMQAKDASLSDRLDALNSTNQALSSADAVLASQIASLMPPKCTSPGGIRLHYDGENWTCVCLNSFYAGNTCEKLTWSLESKLTAASDAGAGDRFGQPVAIYGDVAVISATIHNGQRGAVYVFERATDVWSQKAKLSLDDGAYQDFFGGAVAISGDIIAVAATYDDDNSQQNSGSVSVFTRSDGTWTQQAKLTAGSDASSNDFFGQSVSISGDTIVIGSVNDDTPVFDSGSAYVFTRSDGTWTQQAKLTAGSDAGSRDELGRSISISGDTIVVGAHRATSNGQTNSGSAYVFTRSDGTWTQQAKLTAGSDAGSNDNFGTSVSISGDAIVVGAHYDDDNNADNSGSAYVFTRSDGIWTQQAKLTAGSDAGSNDNFGASVSISGDAIVVGAQYDDDNNADNSGSAYVFTRSDGIWTQQAKLTAGSDAGSNDNFGASVSISGDAIVVGAQYDDDNNADNSGSAYVFSLR